MAIVQEFDLNMIPDSAPVIVHVNQYDEGEGRFEIHLYDGNVPYVPAAGAEAIIQGTKPDGKGFDYNATLSGSTVTADVTKQMTAVAGVVRVQVVITEDDDVTGTFVFGMDVQKSGLPADTDMSASEYQIVEQMIEAAEEAEAVATQSAEDAEAWAVGQRSGSDVPPADPTYHNNSKYWAGKAHEELENKADLVDGKVPSSQLPSYVDDVVEGYYNPLDGKFYKESTYETEIEGERDKIYIDLTTDKSYRWSGSAFVVTNDPDIAENTLNSITTSTATYPAFSAGETLKVIFGKIKKFLSDLYNKKADKVTSATVGNFAGLDSNGNLTDSGNKASDFITSHQTIKQDGVTGATANRFGECTTQASVNDKYVSITEGTFSLEAGAKVTVKFRYTNTSTAPRLKVGNTLAQDIYYRGVQVGPSAPAGVLNGVIDFVYDGSHYNIVGTFVNTTYESKAAVSGGTALSLVTTGEKYIWNNPPSSGHTILNGSGTAMTQRGKLQFVGAPVTDDPTNDKTVVNLGTTVSVTHTLSASANTNFDFTGIGANAVITEILATDGRGYASREYINSGTGIRFVFAPDNSTPTVTMQIRYR